jgi:hypothetical protein
VPPPPGLRPRPRQAEKLSEPPRNRSAIEPVPGAQDPLGLQKHGFRHQYRAASQYDLGPIGLRHFVLDEIAHDNVSIDGNHFRRRCCASNSAHI